MNTLKRFRVGFRQVSLGLCGLLLPFVFAAISARADMLELVNGDHYSGTVMGMTRTNLEFRSDVQGLVKIPRDKVARITFREPLARAVVTNAASAATNGLAAPVAPVPQVQTGSVLQQLREGGVNPNMMDQIQEQLMGKSSPEATKMFNEMVGGLMHGSLQVSDIRAQARKAVQDIKNAKKDLGDDASASELLDGYAGILEKFLRETDEPAQTAPATPAPATPAPRK